jgi:hypothetical protein
MKSEAGERSGLSPRTFPRLDSICRRYAFFSFAVSISDR